VRRTLDIAAFVDNATDSADTVSPGTVQARKNQNTGLTVANFKVEAGEA
jgi:hypothetical protein